MNNEYYYVAKGDLPSFPWKATTGEVCSDCRTKKEAIEKCKKWNKENGF